ncbi:MAG: hypothetical protein WCG47_23445 [Dermatophilaceae bacterium]
MSAELLEWRIMAGIVVAVVISELRLRARGFPNGTAVDLVVWAVPYLVVVSRRPRRQGESGPADVAEHASARP